MLILAIALFILALILFWSANRRRKSIGLPAGRIIYSDTNRWGAVEGSLYDQTLGLAGRPDYLIEEAGKVIPVEVKSSHIAETPYDSHIFQVAAYCLLVERTLDKRPPHGIIHYPNRTFAIDYTPELESALYDLLQEMRTCEKRRNINRSHEAAGRCKACGYREICDQALK
jgi:CRISPR-associated exonuclease Cas4